MKYSVCRNILYTFPVIFFLNIVCFAQEPQPHLDRFTKMCAQGNDLPVEAPAWAMVRDNRDKLIWEIKTTDGSIHNNALTCNWEDANTLFVDELNRQVLGGFSDWRLPTSQELSGLLDYTRVSPAINTDFFPNTNPFGGRYWTSSLEDQYEPPWGWYVDFVTRDISESYPLHPGYVRGVRGEQEDQSNRFVDNDDGTITDTRTGLIWTVKTSDAWEQGSDDRLSWGDAVAWVAELNDNEYLGHNDWRLPSIDELKLFPEDKQTYWSATSYTDNTDGYPAFWTKREYRGHALPRVLPVDHYKELWNGTVEFEKVCAYVSAVRGPIYENKTGVLSWTVVNQTKGFSPQDISFTTTVAFGTPPYTVQYDFGDGEKATEICLHDGVCRVNHTYGGSGSFPVEISLTDGKGILIPSAVFGPIKMDWELTEVITPVENIVISPPIIDDDTVEWISLGKLEAEISSIAPDPVFPSSLIVGGSFKERWGTDRVPYYLKKFAGGAGWFSYPFEAIGSFSSTSFIIGIDPSNPARFYAGTGCTKYSYGRILMTTDGGASWFQIAESAGRASGIAFDPVMSSTYLSTNMCMSHGGVPVHGRIMKTADGGTNWTEIDNSNFDYGGNAYYSGSSWDTTSINDLAISRHFIFSILYAALESQGLYMTIDGGVTWFNVFDDDHISSVELDPNDKQIVYAGGEKGLYKSTDFGMSWSSAIWEGLGIKDSAGVSEIILDPVDSATIYVRARNGIFRSTDNGGKWLRITGVFPSVSAMAVAPGKTGSLVYVASGDEVFVLKGKSAGPDPALVAHFGLDGTVYDSTGSLSYGSEYGGVSYDTGIWGNAAYFDGTDDHVIFSHSPEVSFPASPDANNFTVSTWVYVPSLPDKWSAIVAKSREIAPWYGIWVSSDNHWVFGGSPVSINLHSTAPVRIGWHHIAIVQNAFHNYAAPVTERILYVDGLIQGYRVYDQLIDASGPGDLWLGGADSVDEFFLGAIDDVGIYNRALTITEIQNLYSNGVSACLKTWVNGNQCPAAPIPSQEVYRTGGDLVSIKIPPVPQGNIPYVGILYPLVYPPVQDHFFLITDLNTEIPYNGTLLPWTGEEKVFEFVLGESSPLNGRHLPNGKYYLYFLRVPEGIDPFEDTSCWELGMSNFEVR